MREGLISAEPGLKRRPVLDNDKAAHGMVSDPAQFGAEHFVRTGFCRREPKVGDQSGDQVHLGAELRHVEIVQHVIGPQQEFDRFIDRQVDFGIVDDCREFVPVLIQKIKEYQEKKVTC